MPATPERRALHHVPDAAPGCGRRAVRRQLETGSRGRAVGAPHLVAERGEQLARRILERRLVGRVELGAPVAHAGGRRLVEALLVRLAGRVGATDVVEHAGLELEAGERAHATERGSRIAHEILVAQLEIPVGADAPAERLGRLDLRPPQPGEAGGVLRMAPPLGHDPARHREERERSIAAVPDEVHEARIGKRALEERRYCM